MKERGLNQTALSERAGVAAGNLNDILTKGHMPKVETLFRLAGALDTSRLDILLIAGHLRRADMFPGAPTAPPAHEAESNMAWQLLDEFRRIPPDLRPAALQSLSRLAKVPRYHLIGAEKDEPAESQPLDAHDQ